MRKGSLAIRLGIFCIIAALCLTGYNLYDSARAGGASDSILSALAPHITDSPIPEGGKMISESRMEVRYPDYILNPEMPMPVRNIDGGNYIGILRIPSIDRELPVFGDWNYRNLRTAPCRYAGSVYLDNMVICAHNYDRHFGQIKNLRIGDDVYFRDADGNQFSYKVTEVETLQPRDIEYMKNGEWDLTLFTCTIGGRTRVTVRCERV